MANRMLCTQAKVKSQTHVSVWARVSGIYQTEEALEAQVNECIGLASAEIMSMLGGKFTIDFTAVPSVLAFACAKLASYYLCSVASEEETVFENSRKEALNLIYKIIETGVIPAMTDSEVEITSIDGQKSYSPVGSSDSQYFDSTELSRW